MEVVISVVAVVRKAPNVDEQVGHY